MRLSYSWLYLTNYFYGRTHLFCIEQAILLMWTIYSFTAQEMVSKASLSFAPPVTLYFAVDNVHFQNTAQLVEALTEANVLFDMQVSGSCTMYLYRQFVNHDRMIIFALRNLSRDLEKSFTNLMVL